MSKFTIPQTMRGAVVEAEGQKIIFKNDLPVPKPNRGEVLIKVMASPINPSDLAVISGNNYMGKKYPFTAGLEGSGIVV